MNTEVITVATHKEGYLDNIINNDYNIKVNVLGMGKKWTGFKMKYELVYNYIKNLDDNKLIIFIDGFDSHINGSINKAVDIFKKHNYKVLFSKDNTSDIIGQFLSKKIFSSCYGDTIANTGLYMGYVKYLKKLLSFFLQVKCKDDQVSFNRNCHKFNFINVDSQELIFKNFNMKQIFNTNTKNYKQIFLGFPGQLTINRQSRTIIEYGQFFLDIYLPLLAIAIFFLYKNNKKLVIMILLITIILILKIDKSCI